MSKLTGTLWSVLSDMQLSECHSSPFFSISTILLLSFIRESLEKYLWLINYTNTINNIYNNNILLDKHWLYHFFSIMFYCYLGIIHIQSSWCWHTNCTRHIKSLTEKICYYLKILYLIIYFKIKITNLYWGEENNQPINYVRIQQVFSSIDL